MKVKIGATNDEVEVGHVKAVDKGCFKASFSLVLYPAGQKITECRYFVQGNKKWFSFPQKEVKYTDGRKTEYYPYVRYLNKEYENQIKDAVLECLKNAIPEGSNGQQTNQTYASSGRPSGIQAEPSFDWGAPPF